MENGNCYRIMGYMLGFYRDNGKENGNSRSYRGYIGIYSRYPKQVLAKFLSIIDPAALFFVDEMVWGLSRGP